MNYGYSGLFKSQNKGNTNGVDLFSKINTLNNKITPNRVKSIILDQSHEKFEDLGGWNALGTIETSDGRFIRPLNSNSKIFPLINEIVYIVEGLNIAGENPQFTIPSSYYITNVGIWNHPHHNAYPNENVNQNENDANDYEQAFNGTINDTTDDVTVRRVTDNSTGINLGKTFVERSDIHPLLPFEGDFIQEGRWGNSLRFGSTVQETPNNWSMYGQNGDPITILRNGQGNQTEEGWIPIIEDINNDNSSIYLASTQQVPLTTSGRLDEEGKTDYSSYNNSDVSKPISPTQYAGNQIILNAGRLVFNAKEDHILLTSPLSINLNSQDSVNIDTTKFIVQSDFIYLGNKNQATEPLMLGTQTIEWLKSLMETVENLNNALTGLESNLIPTLPNPSIAVFPTLDIATFQANTTLQTLKKSLKQNILTSKNNFTI
jgi:hypothetical protein